MCGRYTNQIVREAVETGDLGHTDVAPFTVRSTDRVIMHLRVPILRRYGNAYDPL